MSRTKKRKANVASELPLLQYTFAVAVHVVLLTSAALVLPRTTGGVFANARQRPTTSRDRPQHPFLEPLTSDPLATLVCICAGAVVSQAWLGGWMRKWDARFAAGEDLERVKDLRNAWMATAVAAVPVHFIIVLLGAPIASHILHTFFLALLLSLLTVYTPAYTFGLPSFASDTRSLLCRLTWVRLFAELSTKSPVERAILYPVIGSILGCWCGAFPIALDWDRPWQAWPLTPAFGAISGHLLGSIYAVIINASTTLFADAHSRAKAT